MKITYGLKMKEPVDLSIYGRLQSVKVFSYKLDQRAYVDSRRGRV